MSCGMLIDYEWCAGCHSCEVDCDVETTHAHFPKGHCGVKVHEEGLYQVGEEKWTEIIMPIFTDLCDACTARRASGEELPTCTRHCQARVLKFGKLEDLAVDFRQNCWKKTVESECEVHHGCDCAVCNSGRSPWCSQ